MITLLIQLISAHLFGDFIFQTDRLCKMKYSDNLTTRLSGLTIHSGIQALLSYLFIAKWTLWSVPLSIFTCHFIIDFVKVRWGGKKLSSFIIDQCAHYMVIVGIWWILILKGNYLNAFTTFQSFSFWVILTSYIAVLSPTSILIKLFIEHEGWIPNGATLQGLPNAGKWIGFLERILIITFIFTNNVGGIGFLLAAKSIFRFGELNHARDLKLTEYVLIGTLVSFTIAIVIGFGAKWLMEIIK
ncbi:MAG: DUF3307 domain-containing protein [Muribaculaceae bacterium]|nr:DUF3307 domain-containing protein [Muribaculaceae bacterium]